MESPRLPCEVIERVIDFSCGNSRTLRSFSLTCRQLRPRSRCLMLSRVDLRSRDRIFAFVDFLRNNPLMIPFVCSIVVHPLDFAPFPLLHILSGLSHIKFSPEGYAHTKCVLHRSTLACLQHFGSHTQTLHLRNIQFPTFLEFGGVLLAFTNIEHLTCERVTVNGKKGQVPPEAVKRRVYKRMRLKMITIDDETLQEIDGRQAAATLLLDSDLGPSTVEGLRLTNVPYKDTPLPRADWCQLRSLVLQCSNQFAYERVCEFVETFPKGPKLAEVTVEWTDLLWIASLCEDIRRQSEDASSKPYERLERALLRFSQPRIVWIINRPVTAGMKLFWTQELGKHIPMLSRRGALTVNSETGVASVGHEAGVRALTVSPNSEWVATGSDSASTIILWNTDGSIARQWVANSYAGVYDLAFSPNSQYLVSTSPHDTKAEIWDLGCEPATICATFADVKEPCLWSPDGSVIAAVSQGKTVRLWDAQTFQELACSETYADTARLAFSPDGRWLAFRLLTPEYCILDVTLAKPHRLIPASSPYDRWHAFRPGSTHLATKSEPDNSIIFWDVETGEKMLVFDIGSFGYPNGPLFSPDGTRMLARMGSVVHIWDASTGVESVQLTGHTNFPWDACFSPCGRYVATASEDQTVRLWRADNGACLATFSEHGDKVQYIAFSPDGETLSSAAMYGTVCVRRMRDIIRVDELIL